MVKIFRPVDFVVIARPEWGVSNKQRYRCDPELDQQLHALVRLFPINRIPNMSGERFLLRGPSGELEAFIQAACGMGAKVGRLDGFSNSVILFTEERKVK